MARQKQDIRAKVEKEFPEFVGTVASLSLDELEKRISTYAKESEAVETAKSNDAALNEAKDQVSEMGAPYRDAKKAIRMKIRYLIEMVKESGGDA